MYCLYWICFWQKEILKIKVLVVRYRVKIEVEYSYVLVYCFVDWRNSLC